MKPGFPYIILICLLQAATCFGQDGDVWYFGDKAGLSFIPGPVTTAPFPAPVSGNAMQAGEGCASVCDSTGNMLFYTNGRRIYNRVNQVMQNGDNLMGNISSFQGVVIVPLPNSNTIYYVFTSDAFENNFLNGYRYSIVDMAGDGGKGSVTIRDVPLSGNCSERLTAIRHANGVDVWLVTMDANSNIYRCWLLTCNGLQPSPVVSQLGLEMGPGVFMNVGCLKGSPDGTALCQTYFAGNNTSDRHYFQVFDFNKLNGVISSPRSGTLPGRKFYAAEFSPNSQIIYLSDPDKNTIIQANRFGSLIGTIPADYGIHGLQLGPDGKIYLSRVGPKLSVIQQPDSPGLSCRLRNDVHNMAPAAVQLNLPNYINDAFFDNPANIQVYTVDACEGKIKFFTAIAPTPPAEYLWNFGDGTTSQLQNPEHTYAQPRQRYRVTLTVRGPNLCGVIRSRRQIQPLGLKPTASFSFVTRCDSGYVRFINQSTAGSGDSLDHTWEMGDGTLKTGKNPVHRYADAGTYTVRLITYNGPACNYDTISKTVVVEKITVKAPPDTTLREGESIVLNLQNNGGTLFNWQPADYLSNTNSLNPTATPLDDIRYFVTARNGNGCFATDSVRIKITPLTGVYMPTAFSPNGDGVNDRLKPVFSKQMKLKRFAIYNRWGQLLFVTDQFSDIAWNGFSKGTLAETGLYVWQLVLIDKSGREIVKKGTVVLMR